MENENVEVKKKGLPIGAFAFVALLAGVSL